MKRTLLLTAVVFASLACFAQQNLCPSGTVPTGGMDMYFQAKPAGGCAAWQGLNNPPSGATQFALPQLSNGAATVSGNWGGLVGTQQDVCIYAYYSGDANCAEGNLAPVVYTVAPPPFKGPVTITLTAVPNPIVQNQTVTFNITVAPQ